MNASADTMRLLGSLFDKTRVRLAMMDRHYRFIHVNPAFARHFGRPADDFTGLRMDEIFTLESRTATAITQMFDQVVATRNPLRTTGWPLDFAGVAPAEKVVLEWSIEPIFTATGEAEFIFISAANIAIHKAQEEALRATEWQFRNLVEHLPDVVVRYDLACRRVYANERHLRITGLSPDEALHRPPDKHWWGAPAAEAYVALLRDVMATGKTVEVTANWNTVEGTPLTLAIQVSPERDEHGNIQGAVMIGRDVTAQHEAERNLTTLVENLPDFVMRLDGKCHLLYVSPAMTGAFALGSEAFIGKHVTDIEAMHFDGEHLRVEQAIQAAARDGTATTVEATWRTVDGLRTFEVRYVPEKDERGQVTSILGVARDVTERKATMAELGRLNATLEQRVKERTAALQEANSELESFSYSVSHDLRAPLRAISGFTQILARRHRDRLDDEGRHYLDNVLVASRRMEHLIDDLLHYSRTGRGAVNLMPVPLAPLVEHFAILFGERMTSSGAKLIVDEPLATPQGDPRLVEQILTNLVDNALTYHTVDVPPVVRISASVEDGMVALRVADNGIGIAPEYHEKIFQLFQRLHGEDEYPGTGIGLAIVAKAARAMDGSVAVESTPGQGSVFTVYLPAVPSDAATSARPLAASPVKEMRP